MGELDTVQMSDTTCRVHVSHSQILPLVKPVAITFLRGRGGWDIVKGRDSRTWDRDIVNGRGRENGTGIRLIREGVGL